MLFYRGLRILARRGTQGVGLMSHSGVRRVIKRVCWAVGRDISDFLSVTCPCTRMSSCPVEHDS